MMRHLTQVALVTALTSELINISLSADTSGDGSEDPKHRLLQQQQPRYDVGIYENALNFSQFLAELNLTTNDTGLEVGEKIPMDAWNKWCTLMQDRALVVSLLLIFSLTTVFGNMLVILAVIRERCLHTATNYFITSLAVADCLVGFVVMPFSAMYEVLEHTWFFGSDLCDIWRSLDVLFSTASILNLCVISLDRYWAITDPMSYPMRMTRSKSGVLIATVWICSSGISFPAIAWWRAVRRMPIPPYKCPFTENLGYLVFSSTISFYLPLFVMVFTYFRIYKAAVEQTKSLRLGTKQVLLGAGNLELTLRIHRGGTCKLSNSSGGGQGYSEDEPLTALQNNGLVNNRMGAHSKNFSLSRKLAKFAKEKKAAKTLGIVMGVFICCWLPFFVVNLLSGFCDDCIWNEQVVLAIVTWLGWINSSMNPVIYALWSKDFRRAFLRILCVCCPRKISNKYQPAYRNKPSQHMAPARSSLPLSGSPASLVVPSPTGALGAAQAANALAVVVSMTGTPTAAGAAVTTTALMHHAPPTTALSFEEECKRNTLQVPGSATVGRHQQRRSSSTLPFQRSKSLFYF